MKRIVLGALLAALLLPCISLPAQEMDRETYLKRPGLELYELQQQNFEKGRELYEAGQFRESIEYFEVAIFLSGVIIEQARIRKDAQDKLAEAREWIEKAGRIVEKERK